MPSFNSVVLTIDDIRFKWPTRRVMTVYAVATAVDNRGRVHVFESPGRKRLVHRPLQHRPAVWDAGHDGLLAYQSTGQLPAVVAYAITLVRDRRQARTAGQILQALRDSQDFKALQTRLGQAAASSWPATIAVGFITPIVGIIGQILGSLEDRPIDTVFGSKVFERGETRREIGDRVIGSIFDADVEFTLFSSDVEREEAIEPGAGSFAVFEPPARLSVPVGREFDAPLAEALAPAVEALAPAGARVGTGRVVIGGRRKDVMFAEVDALAVLEGDIVLGDTARLAASAADVNASLGFGLGIEDGQYHWPEGQVPYALHPELSAAVREKIMAALRHWEEVTPIRFVPHTAEHANWVLMVPAAGCASEVGCRGGEQRVWLSEACSVGNVIHELAHTVGLWHEQSREDRDGFVTIHWENVQAGAEHNFRQHIDDGVDIGDYDYRSIMHYPRTAFSKNGEPTIVAPPDLVIGQREGLSAGDIAAVRELYPTLGWAI